MTLLLVMAAHGHHVCGDCVTFWKRWGATYFSSAEAFKNVLIRIMLATFMTGLIGYPVKKIVEKLMFPGAEKAEIEQLFGRLDLIAIALFCAGCLILWAGLARRRNLAVTGDRRRRQDGLTLGQAGVIGGVQGLSLPFRGFSRSGTTISAGMLERRGARDRRDFQLCAGGGLDAGSGRV